MDEEEWEEEVGAAKLRVVNCQQTFTKTWSCETQWAVGGWTKGCLLSFLSFKLQGIEWRSFIEFFMFCFLESSTRSAGRPTSGDVKSGNLSFDPNTPSPRGSPLHNPPSPPLQVFRHRHSLSLPHWDLNTQWTESSLVMRDTSNCINYRIGIVG